MNLKLVQPREYHMINTKWITHARLLANGSKDPSTKVGCVIISEEDRMIGSAYNDLAKGTPESYWKTPELKYPHVVHAEMGALIQCGEQAKGATLYCSCHPCRDCAKHIIYSGIKCVVCPSFPWRDVAEVRDSISDAKAMFERAGVLVQYV